MTDPSTDHIRQALNTEPFRSTAAMTSAIADPRYRNDPAYRQDVADRVAAAAFHGIAL
jgi:hypothetical protein